MYAKHANKSEIYLCPMIKSYDVCIVGGGVVGLWIARRLTDSGLKIVLVEQETCGAGASGGVLGALMAHAPDNWNAKKQFQFDALAELPALITRLENETGLSTGYARCGRLMPLRRRNFVAQSRQRAEQAQAYWQSHGKAFAFEVVENMPEPGWLNPECAPFGFVHDHLAARINPRRYIAALKASAQAASRTDILEHWPFGHFDESRSIVRSEDGANQLIAKDLVLAAGYRTFSLLEPVLGCTIGGGVKGQAAMFNCPAAAGKPLIYDDGTYIVPHYNGLCAVGSTSEKQWQAPTTPDEGRTDFIERAQALCPPLRDADMLGRWAGVRPRCKLTDPIIGQLAPGRSIWVATGGYKITFGIAHRMAAAIADALCTRPSAIELPPSFQPAHHLQGEHRC